MSYEYWADMLTDNGLEHKYEIKDLLFLSYSHHLAYRMNISISSYTYKIDINSRQVSTCFSFCDIVLFSDKKIICFLLQQG